MRSAALASISRTQDDRLLAVFDALVLSEAVGREVRFAAVAIAAARNLVSFMFAAVYFPTYSNALKDIAGWLGYRWSSGITSGIESLRRGLEVPLDVGLGGGDTVNLRVVVDERQVLALCSRVAGFHPHSVDGSLHVVKSRTGAATPLAFWNRLGTVSRPFERWLNWTIRLARGRIRT